MNSHFIHGYLPGLLGAMASAATNLLVRRLLNVHFMVTVFWYAPAYHALSCRNRGKLLLVLPFMVAVFWYARLARSGSGGRCRGCGEVCRGRF